MPDEKLTVDQCIGNTIEATVRTEARGEKLVGAIVSIDAKNSNAHESLIAQIANVDRSNQIHRDQAFRIPIAERGSLPYISGDADTENCVLTPMAIRDENTGDLCAWSVKPASGTPARIASTETMERFFAEPNSSVYIGSLPGHQGTKLAVVAKGFGPVDTGGYGEGVHTLVCGETGSGKTVMAQQLIAMRLLKDRDMGCLILDTQSDFVRPEKFNKKGEYEINYIRLIEDGGRAVTIINASDLRLPDNDDLSSEAMRDRLGSALRSGLNTDKEHADGLYDEAMSIMYRGQPFAFDTFDIDVFLQSAAEAINQGLVSWTDARTAERNMNKLPMLTNNARFMRSFRDDVQALFQGTVTPEEIARRVLSGGEIIVLNIPSTDVIRASLVEKYDSSRLPTGQLMLKAMLLGVNSVASDLMWNGNQANALIVLDEASRWAPQSNDKAHFRDLVEDLLKTLRKYGVGCMAITQRLADLSKSVVAQCRTTYALRGLDQASDLSTLEGIVGTPALEMYKALNMSGAYFTLVKGADLAYGRGGVLAIETLGRDVNQQLKDLNPSLFKKAPPAPEAVLERELPNYEADGDILFA